MTRSLDQAVFIGIDGGGTHSFAIAVNSTGRRLATAEAGSLNFFGTGLPIARRHLKRLRGALARQLPPRTRIDRIVVGCAALFSDATIAEKENLCRGILPLERTRVISDCQTACFGATLGRPGVVIIAGTGSIVVAQNEKGQQQRIGGWGHILGDEGSAYWMAVEAVKAAIAAEAGLGSKTSLGRWICQWFKVKELMDVVPMIHDSDFTKERFASLTSHLARKAGSQDTAFREICRRAARELASQALSAVKLAPVNARPLPVYLIGGVLTNNALVRVGLVAALKNACPVRIVKPRLSPLLGAAALTLEDAGIELTADVVANLAESDSGATLGRSERL
jgi:N-acetylglucosamine kinase-like BadF-type ATPase